MPSHGRFWKLGGVTAAMVIGVPLGYYGYRVYWTNPYPLHVRQPLRTATLLRSQSQSKSHSPSQSQSHPIKESDPIVVHYREALQEAERAGLPQTSPSAYTGIWMELGDYQVEQAWIRDAIQSYRHALACTLQQLQQVPEAISPSSPSPQQHQQQQQEQHQQRIRAMGMAFKLAEQWCALSNWEEAERLLVWAVAQEPAISYTEDEGNRKPWTRQALDRVGPCMELLGRVYGEGQGRWEAAYHTYAGLLGVLRECKETAGNKCRQAIVLNNLGNVVDHLGGEPVEVLQWYPHNRRYNLNTTRNEW